MPKETRHRGWHSRGYLPHFDSPGAVQAVTFRLGDSLPRHVIDAERSEAASVDRAHWAAMLDTGHGECLLRDPRTASIVESALLHFDGARYRMLAWCVMPNHVHAVIATVAGHALSEIVHSWKSFTAKRINSMTGRTGAVWYPDYFDRHVRDEAHLEAVIRYVHENPVAAGLVTSPEDWPTSSARYRSTAEAARAGSKTSVP